MREALAFLLLILLISFGWNQSFLEHYTLMTGGTLPKKPAARAAGGAAAQPAPAPAPGGSTDSSWMWQKSKLDGPDDRGRR